MNNLCLPMKVINITQRSGGTHSHPNYCLDLAGSDTGIDFAFAMGDFWKCIAGPWGSHTYFFTACDTAGTPVPVHCADGVNRIVTMALTHGAFLFVKAPIVGKVYKNGDQIYEEGTYSIDPKIPVTGNHIHFEVAEGVQKTKTKDKSMGVYRMKNELKPEDVCFICDSFSTVGNMGGAIMKHCAGIPYTTPQTRIADGLSRQTYAGQEIVLYKQSGKEKVAIVSCEYGKVCSILDVKLPGKKIKAVMNASYFLMNAGGGFLGRVQGFLNGTADQHIDARPASPAEKGQKGDKGYMDLVLLKNGNISFGDFNSWDYPIDDVVFGVSPAGIEIADGMAVNKYSPECGYGKITTPGRQSILMRAFDGSFIFGTVPGKLTPIPELRTWGLTVGLNHLSVYDSGGSTQMAVGGKIIVESSDNPDRLGPVWFVFYEDEEEPEKPVEIIGTIHCLKEGLNIRKGIRGQIISTAKKGEDVELVEFIDGIQSDGYQWVKARFKDVVGFAQFDSSVLWIELKKEREGTK